MSVFMYHSICRFSWFQGRLQTSCFESHMRWQFPYPRWGVFHTTPDDTFCKFRNSSLGHSFNPHACTCVLRLLKMFCLLIACDLSGFHYRHQNSGYEIIMRTLYEESDLNAPLKERIVIMKTYVIMITCSSWCCNFVLIAPRRNTYGQGVILMVTRMLVDGLRNSNWIAWNLRISICLEAVAKFFSIKKTS